ncbi:CxC2 domain-containing protein [Mycena kentingensis (nom. inval.)]|nr:CxC2 domain-containing protein [Mycena kentingensis (nom. inval.)]
MDNLKRKRGPAAHTPTTSNQTHTFSLAQFLPPAPDAPLLTFVDRVSSDNRRVYSNAIPVPPSSPVKRVRVHAHTNNLVAPPPLLLLVEDQERYTMAMDGIEEDDGDAEGPERRGHGPADEIMRQWMQDHRDAYLRVLLWREGRACDVGIAYSGVSLAPSAASQGTLGIPFIGNGPASILRASPSASVGSAFSLVTPTVHPAQDPAADATTSSSLTTTVSIKSPSTFVDAIGLPTPTTYNSSAPAGTPASMDSPRTCVTFACLDQFQTLSLHGKTNAYDYYAALETQTNAVGVKPPDRYKVFLRMSRQWRHLQLLKRGGRGHDKYGVVGTGPGELAVRCPVCPRPEVNLPNDWAHAAPEDRCLYTFFVAIDACFRLKRRIISSWARDPGLGTGWAYMLEPRPYEEYLVTVGEQKEMSTCSGLAAEWVYALATSSYCQLGSGICNAGNATLTWIGSLYPSCATFVSLLWLIVSYDIACQWYKNLKARLAALPPLMRLQALQTIIALARFAIPKMHIKGHIFLCQLLFAFGLIPGSGQVDGEGVERPWSMLGGVAASTRASGPGSRADQLDDHLGFWNWLKVIRLASLLRRRLDKARLEHAKQETEFAELSKQQADDVEGWKARVHAFETDRTLPNPYEPVTDGLTERDVRNQFEEEEAMEEEAGRRIRLHHVGPAEFLSILLQIEDEHLKRAKTSAVKINLRKQRRGLNKSISRLRTLQAVYSPAALQYLASLKLPQETAAEQVPLLPPSALSEAQHIRDIKVPIHAHAHFVARNENKILLRADKYQAARCALVALAAGSISGVSWPVLLKEHIRCMDDSDDAFVPPEDRQDVFGASTTTTPSSRPTLGVRGRPGETHRVMSWIWKFTGRAGSDEELRESIRIEWCKAYARTRRWEEEVRILEEEWRRFPLSMAYEEERWVQRATSIDVGDLDVEDAEGLLAYAAKQADVFRGIARRAEVIRTAPAYRRGHRRPRENTLEGVMEMPESVEPGASGYANEEIEDFVDELGNTSDDEEYILDGDSYD